MVNPFEQFQEQQPAANPFEQFNEPVAPKMKTEPRKLERFTPGNTGSFADAVGQGVSFGFADELAGVLGASYGTLMPESLGGFPEHTTWGDAYHDITGIARQQATDFGDRNPKTALASEIAGGLLTGGAGLIKVGAKLAPKGAGLVRRMATGGGIGATEGAIAGAGSSVEGERIKGAQIGALLGAPLGVAGGELANWMGKRTAAKKTLMDKLQDTPESAETVGKMIKKASADGVTGKDLVEYGEEVTENFQRQNRNMKELATDYFDKLTKRNKTDRVVNDDLEIEAVRQGWDKGILASLRGMKGTDKTKAIQMLQTMKKGKEFARFGRSNRPSDIAGDSFYKQVSALKDLNASAGTQLDGVSKNLKGVDVNFDSIVNEFVEDLDDMGVKLGKFTDDGFVNFDEMGAMGLDPSDIKANFVGSDIEGLKGIENFVNRLIKRMNSGDKMPDGYDLHRLKKYIDENVGYGKQSAEGLTGKTEVKVKKFRRQINQLLQDASPEYKQVNTQYADTIGALNNLNAATPGKLDIHAEGASKVLGGELRKLFSNYSSRQPLENSIYEIGGVLKKYGHSVDDDLISQTMFYDELNRMFGNPATTGFQADMAKGVKQGIEAATGVSSPKAAAQQAVANKLGGMADAMRGINDDAAFKSMLELLRR